MDIISDEDININQEYMAEQMDKALEDKNNIDDIVIYYNQRCFLSAAIIGGALPYIPIEIWKSIVDNALEITGLNHD